MYQLLSALSNGFDPLNVWLLIPSFSLLDLIGFLPHPFLVIAFHQFRELFPRAFADFCALKVSLTYSRSCSRRRVHTQSCFCTCASCRKADA